MIHLTVSPPRRSRKVTAAFLAVDPSAEYARRGISLLQRVRALRLPRYARGCRLCGSANDGAPLLENFWWGSVFVPGTPAMVLLVVGPVLPEYRNPRPGGWTRPVLPCRWLRSLPAIYGSTSWPAAAGSRGRRSWPGCRGGVRDDHGGRWLSGSHRGLQGDHHRDALMAGERLSGAGSLGPGHRRGIRADLLPKEIGPEPFTGWPGRCGPVGTAVSA